MENEASILVTALSNLWESSPNDRHKIVCQIFEKDRNNELLAWGLYSKILLNPIENRHFLFIELLNAIPLKIYGIAFNSCNKLIDSKYNQCLLRDFLEKIIKTSALVKNISNFDDFFRNIVDIYQGGWELFRRNFASAEKILQKWIYNHPEETRYFPFIYLLLASIYRSQTVLKRSIDCIHKGLQYLSNNEVFLCRLGQIYGEMKLYPEANKTLNQAFHLYPNSAEILLQQGWIALQNRQFEIAENLHANAMNLDPNNPNVHCAYGDCYSLQDLNVNAIPYYEKAIELNPFIIQYYKNLGVTYLELKSFEKADLVLQNITRLDPERVEGWFALGWLKSDQALYSDALNYFQKALQLDNNNIELIEDIADCYIKLNEQKKSVNYLKKALSIDPKNVDILWRLANIYFDDEKLDQAVELWKKCVVIDPNHIQALNSLALYFDEYIDDFDKAKELYDRALKSDSTQYTSINLAQAYFNRELFDDAEKVLQEILARSPPDYRPYYYLGLIERDYHNQYQKAAKLFQQALSVEEKNVLVTMDLIELYLNQLNEPNLAENLVHTLEKNEDDDPILKFFLDKVKTDIAGRNKKH